MKTNQQLNIRMKVLRLQNGSLSQEDLAKKVGISRQSILAIETGKSVPSTTLAIRIAKELNTTVEELFKEE